MTKVLRQTGRDVFLGGFGAFIACLFVLIFSLVEEKIEYRQKMRYTDKYKIAVYLQVAVIQSDTTLKAGFRLGEQEKYKRMLKKVIDETENQKINSTEELIQRLIHELTNSNTLNVKQNFQ